MSFELLDGLINLTFFLGAFFGPALIGIIYANWKVK
jgi:hypothetical protein